MKLLFCTPHLATGGSERVMSLLANKFAKEGHHVEIALLSSNKCSYYLDDAIVTIYAGGDSNIGIIKRLFWLRKHVKEQKPDVIVAFLEKAYCFAILSLIGINVRLIASERNDPTSSLPQWKILKRLLLPKANHLVVQTQKIKEYFTKGIQQKTTIIFNPVTDKVFNLQNSKKSKVIVAVGRLYPQKNHKMLIKAFSLIGKKYLDYNLLIYGDGPLNKSLKEQIHELSLENRCFLMGRSENVVEEMGKAEIFCLSSDYEGMSNALIEAVCIGLPIVTTNVSGTETFLENGINALIVDTNDALAFAKAMDRLLSDKTLRTTMANANKAKAELFRMENIYIQWASLIDRLL
jgi:glycosyltransferase involved in cell wall biosynthesis